MSIDRRGLPDRIARSCKSTHDGDLSEEAGGLWVHVWTPKEGEDDSTLLRCFDGGAEGISLGLSVEGADDGTSLGCFDVVKEGTSLGPIVEGEDEGTSLTGSDGAAEGKSL